MTSRSDRDFVTPDGGPRFARRPRGYSRIVYALYRTRMLHRVAFKRPSPHCHPPALTWFGRLLNALDYHLDYDGLRDE